MDPIIRLLTLTGDQLDAWIPPRPGDQLPDATEIADYPPEQARYQSFRPWVRIVAVSAAAILMNNVAVAITTMITGPPTTSLTQIYGLVAVPTAVGLTLILTDRYPAAGWALIAWAGAAGMYFLTTS